MEWFDKEEEPKHECKRNVEFITKYGKREERFGDEEPKTII